jgi:hypothetical protein
LTALLGCGCARSVASAGPTCTGPDVTGATVVDESALSSDHLDPSCEVGPATSGVPSTLTDVRVSIAHSADELGKLLNCTVAPGDTSIDFTRQEVLAVDLADIVRDEGAFVVENKLTIETIAVSDCHESKPRAFTETSRCSDEPAT